MDVTKLNEMAERVFLALVIWREARGESYVGKLAVAHSILNRVNRPSWWGNDLLSVLWKKWQYSSVTDPKDLQLTRWPLASDPTWNSSLLAACETLDGISPNPVQGADSYYDISIKPPYWATPETLVRKIGKLVFHNLDHDPKP